jgi:peptidoglycan/xylan/chitin deacetylase (PgdA/CDA1 family)
LFLYVHSGPELLELLALYNISATFFIVASHLDKSNADYVARRDLVKRMLREGHMIGSHTWSHHVFKHGESASLVTSQLERAEVFLLSSHTCAIYMCILSLERHLLK